MDAKSEYKRLQNKIIKRVTRQGLHENEGNKEAREYNDYVMELYSQSKLSYGEAIEWSTKLVQWAMNYTG